MDARERAYVPAIHVLLAARETWMPATSAGMTEERGARSTTLLPAAPPRLSSGGPAAPPSRSLGGFDEHPALGGRSLGLAAPRMQDPLGVAVRLRAPLEDQVACRREGRSLEARRHRAVTRIARVLAVDYLRHPLERVHHLRLCHQSVAQPVGDVLARNAQRRAVLHQPDIVDVRHLGAADALVDPAHHVAQNSLRVVVELLRDLLRAWPRQRDG